MNLEQIRKDTPGCADKLFFNSAGSSLPPASVTQRIKNYLDEEELTGGYRLAELKEAQLNRFYEHAARILNTVPKNIAFATNATDAYSQALSSVRLLEGDLIITSNDDYVSNYMHFISLQKKQKIVIDQVRNLDSGDLDLDHFKKLIEKKKPRLVAITHAPTSSGLVQDVEAIGEICSRNDILYLVDACQSVGQIEVDVKKIKCDYLSATGRKFLRGPRGTGFLYVSDKVLNRGLAPMYIDLRGSVWIEKDSFELEPTARRFERWEIPYALMDGLTEAFSYYLETGTEAIWNYNTELSQYFRNQLSLIQDVSIYDKGTRKCSIITFRKKNKELDYMNKELIKQNVHFSVSTRSSAFIDFSRKGIDWAIRLSPHYFNTREEVDDLCRIIDAL